MAYPKPDDQRVTRTKQAFSWTDLPAESGIAPPDLPDTRKWHSQTLEWWAMLWAKGQATQWDPTGQTLWTLAALYDDMFKEKAEPAKVSAEIRQHEDRHGLNPKAMLQLRWRFAESEPETVRRPRAKSERRKAALEVLDGGA